VGCSREVVGVGVGAGLVKVEVVVVVVEVAVVSVNGGGVQKIPFGRVRCSVVRTVGECRRRRRMVVMIAAHIELDFSCYRNVVK